MDKSQMYEYLDQKQDTLTDVANHIWDYAETAFEEFKSAELLEKVLRENGFQVEEGVGKIKTAFCATYGTGKPVIGILAEFDALSGLSQKAHSAVREPVVENGNGHGCGHNLFAGGSVGAALAVKAYLESNKRPGTVKLFGCPGEEGGSGKAFMAREGVFKGLDIALAWHPQGVNAIFDINFLANYQILYKFKGVAAHAAAAPQMGRSALDAVELMDVGVNYLREHIIPEARVHYAITNSGGFSPNVVQPEASVLYLIRAPKTSQVEEIYQRVNKIAQGAALMTETSVEIQFIKACANVVPNKSLSKAMFDNLKSLKLPEYTPEEIGFANEIAKTVPQSKTREEDLLHRVGTLPPEDFRCCVQQLKGKSLCDIVIPFYEDNPSAQMTMSSDVGDVSWNVPTAQVVTTCYAMGTPEHSWQLVSQDRTSIGYKGMMLAAKTIAGTAVDALENPALIEKAKKEFHERLEGETYRCSIPKDVFPRPIRSL